MSEEMARAAAALSGAREVALACHVNPDPDALGSMLGLSNHLRSRGVSTVCSFGNDPFLPPRWLERLPGAEALVPPSTFPPAPGLMVTCDTASLDRLGVLVPSARAATELIWIDHHASNEGLGTIPLIDPTASSTAEMVVRLIRAMGDGMPDEAAVCLYAGLITDTGRFQYQAVRPDTLRLAADLREHPFDHAALSQALYEDNRADYLRLLGALLQRLVLEPELDLVWTYLTRSDLAEAGVEAADADDLIDVLRTAREADIAAVIKQQHDGRFKVSLRSRGGHDVASVAARFGGGGHRLAAGYTSRHGLALTMDELRSALRDASGG
ncbi:MAG TPA: bifunctional oligoribonuclease/PAP phosphatase NrnA [Actinomycetota bacterium]|jgi:phosphoesterase RecJ-like protein|nr:bifunctional oligoribonuclease/PAP phosphatase NrnA [Actinomycetota bacterium]